MTYGIQVKNEIGEDVFDFNKSLTITETGLTSPADDLGLIGYNGSVFFPLHPITPALYTIVTSDPSLKVYYPHFIGSNSQLVAGNSGTTLTTRVPTPLNSMTTTVFYQVGTIGLLHHSEHVIDGDFSVGSTPNKGMFSVCLPTDNQPLPYIKVDNVIPTSFSENYGFQINSSSGNTLFDSRSDFLSISEVLFVSKSSLDGVILDNSVIDLTLRTPVPNCYISCPQHSSFRLQNGPGYSHVKVSQTNPSTIRLSRQQHGTPRSNVFELTLTNDLVIIVARNPFQ